ncbi:hypothetical protein L3476_27390 [Paenibacillus thiaminolyticus]|uniref:hypothetical protein n=1 Tax=Paenibacillus thiaminolyticus TaxID=49283 RepID=UPI0023505ADD|nr:hypothetical protein [Paenibacillus thiaminolyticus]WCR26871.1 hypothetical protein L3476_27390 [Paenibacillus thiaminolyticus]
MSQAEVKLDLSRIVFIGRTFEEYMKMFDLSAEQMAGKRILDCPSGACSFTAVASQLGVDVTAADIAYYYAPEELERKGVQDIEHAMGHMEKAQANLNRKYEHAGPLLEYIDSQGWDAEEVSVPYRFQKNADTMLKLSRRR